jgi:Acetyltransferase (GNAT) family
MTYRPRGNHTLWAPRERREDAVYVSRLIVARNVAGDGIGAALIDWAAARAVRDWNARWIRIDVWTINVALHNYYEKRGFRYLRIASREAERYPSAALFQKPTSEIDLEAAGSFQLDPVSEPGRPPASTRRPKQDIGRCGLVPDTARVPGSPPSLAAECESSDSDPAIDSDPRRTMSPRWCGADAPP